MTTSSTTPLGTYPLTITGTSGTLTHTANVTLNVSATPPPPDYTLTATPSIQSVVVGSATTYTHYHWRLEWIFRSSDAERERIARRHDREFLTRHSDRFRQFYTDGDDQWNDSGRNLLADHHRHQRHSDSFRRCDAGCDHDASATELHSDHDAEYADGGGRECDDLHHQHWGVERIFWSSDAECERTADGSTASFLPATVTGSEAQP